MIGTAALVRDRAAVADDEFEVLSYGGGRCGENELPFRFGRGDEERTLPAAARFVR